MRRGEEKIVGRKPEMEMLASALDAAAGGRGQVVLLQGEAGMGKTALVEYVSARAGEMGMRICTGECTSQEAGMPYRVLQDALGRTDIFSLEEFAFFDEVFLISKVGLLISHASRSQAEGMDEDILGSMLTAVQDFVKDSFGGGGQEGEGGGLGKLEYRDTKIMIEHGDFVYLAAVVSGEEHTGMRRDLKGCLARIEETYFDILADWDGDLDALAGTGNMLEELVSARYQVRRRLEDIDLDRERLKVQDKMLDAINSLAGGGLLLILEDMHWADESSLAALPYLARNIAGTGVMLCITFRPGELTSRPGAAELLENLSALPDCRKIDLKPLAGADILTLVSMELEGGEPPEELAGSLVANSGGNPLFVIEAVRALRDSGQLARDGEVWVLRHGPGAEIPGSVMDIVARRLENLEPDTLALLEYGAVLGRRVDLDILLGGFGIDDSHAARAVETLEGMGLLERAGDDGCMRFVHSAVQEAIYATMGDRWKLVLHRRAGETLEAMHKADRHEHLFELAYHFGRTRDLVKGIDYSVLAGYKAMNSFAPEEAVGFLSRALELMEQARIDDPRYTEVHEALGEMHEMVGDPERARETYLKLADMLGPGERGNALMKAGRTLLAQGRYDDAEAMLNDALTAARENGQAMLEARTCGYLGKICLRRGDHDRALELQRTYMRISQTLGEAMDQARAHMNMGGVYWHMSDYPMAVGSWLESLKLFTGLGHKQGMASVNDNLGVGYFWMGDYDHALEHYLEAARMMEETGDVRGMSMVWNNLGVLYDRIDQPARALEHFRKSLRLKKRIGDMIGQANIYNNMGVIHFFSGEHDEALEDYRSCLALMEECGDTWGAAQALGNMAEAEIEAGMLDAAEEHSARAEQMAREHELTDILAAVQRIRAVLRHRQGREAEAEKLLDEGLELAASAGEPELVGMAYLTRARLLRSRGETEPAVDAYASALKTFDEGGMLKLARMTREEMQELVDAERLAPDEAEERRA